MSNRVVVEQWVQAFHERDAESAEALMHPDIVISYPQSGETLSGIGNCAAMTRAFKSRGLPRGELTISEGPREHVTVLTPGPLAMPSIEVTGDGNLFIVEGKVTYPEGDDYFLVMLVRVDAGKVISETTYFGHPFEPAPWRAQFTDTGTSVTD